MPWHREMEVIPTGVSSQSVSTIIQFLRQYRPEITVYDFISIPQSCEDLTYVDKYRESTIEDKAIDVLRIQRWMQIFSAVESDHIDTTITIEVGDCEDIVLVDGHHRFRALMELLEAGRDYTINVDFISD